MRGTWTADGLYDIAIDLMYTCTVQHTKITSQSRLRPGMRLQMQGCYRALSGPLFGRFFPVVPVLEEEHFVPP